MSQALSADFAYSRNGKPSHIASTRYRVSTPPSNGGSFSMGDTIRLELPSSRFGSWLLPRETYLKFKMDASFLNGTADTFSLDGGADCVISRIVIRSGANELENIQNYDLLSALWRDAMNDTNMYRVGGLSYGDNEVFDDDNLGSQTHTFCVPIMSGVIGSLMNKALPLGFVNSDLQIEIVLNAFNTAFVATNAVGNTNQFRITDMSLITEHIDLPLQVAQNIRESLGGVISISTESFQSAENIEVANATKGTPLLPFRFSSLKSVLNVWRKETDTTALNQNSITTRKNVIAETGSYQYRIQGNLLAPQTPIQGEKEAYVESVQKGLSKHFNTKSATTIQKTNWLYGDTGANSTTFFLCLNTEVFPGDGSRFESGENTLGSGSSFLNINYGYALPTNHLLTSYGHYDCLLTIDSNSGQMMMAY